ncbi:MAG: excinuclease ABC subunit UvrC [Acidobacteriota bacterium]
MKEKLVHKIEDIPFAPGVYQFLNGEGQTIYVGKAKSLKNRARSYFQKSTNSTPKTQQMLSEAEDVRFIVTASELEALILEGNLIKKEKPKYNIVLRDDKNFPYLKLTIKEKYPRVVLVRKAGKDGNLYFGPYLPARVARRTLKMIPKFFRVAVCNYNLDVRKRRPCLYYQLDQCLAPCDEKIDRESYLKAVDAVRLFLEGKNSELLANLRANMMAAAREERFEEAAFYRDTIGTIKRLSEKQIIISVGLEDQDYFAHYGEKDKIALQVFNMRNGHVQSRREFTFEGIDLDQEPFYQTVILQYYSDRQDIPDSIYTPESFPEMGLVEKMLSSMRGRRVKILTPRRGPRKSFLETVKKNARLLFDIRFGKEMNRREDGLEELREAVKISQPLRRIEAFDVSNIHGTDCVASMVVFEDGGPSRKDYRRFRIKTVSGVDDFASMAEVVGRRYRRAMEEKGKLPDLILVDGGKGQLSSTVSALTEIGIEGVAVAGFEKGEEKLYLSGREGPVLFETNSRALNLIRRIRDEAHRFAIAYHRKLRTRRTLTSELTIIPGIGKKTAEKLLKEFGSVEGIKTASSKELSRIAGKSVAAAIDKHFR